VVPELIILIAFLSACSFVEAVVVEVDAYRARRGKAPPCG
jgi:hypothetical protein